MAMYRSYEEFQREELRKMERMDMSFEDLLSEFDNDRHRTNKKKQGLFDTYDEDENDEEYEYDD